MKRILALLAALVLAVAAQAQSSVATGQITKLDKAGGKVTLKHGEIKSLDMPPMTMAYRVRDAKALEGLAVGDQVRFTAEKVDGNFTVTSISKAP
jgi:Cu/Ag efflux protein CusF